MESYIRWTQAILLQMQENMFKFVVKYLKIRKLFKNNKLSLAIEITQQYFNDKINYNYFLNYLFTYWING